MQSPALQIWPVAEQSVWLNGAQMPVPVHTLVLNAMGPLQDGAAHTMPAAGKPEQAPAPLQTPGEPHTPLPTALHSLSGSVLNIIGAHTPLGCPVFACDAAMHDVLQALLAQKPSTQDPVWQLPLVAQALPCASSAGATQMPELQVPVWQSLPARHCLPWAQTLQVPPQSTSVSVPFLNPSLQVAGGAVQAPAPLQVLAPAHSLFGSWPNGMLEHVPVEPGIFAAMHKPVQAVLAQTPSTQLPLWHWLPATHALPLNFNSVWHVAEQPSPFTLL
jgi:hypothetical protein